MGTNGWQVTSLALAAIIGGYLLTTASGMFLGAVLPLTRGEAVVTAYLVSFVVYTGAVLWVFAVRKPLRAWAGLLVPAIILATVGLVLA